jgi:hypothetical protein
MNIPLPNSNISPDQWISPSRVTRSNFPFRHAIYDDFLNREIYDLLCFEFNDRLSLGLHKSPALFRFVRQHTPAPTGLKQYDMYTIVLPARVHWPLSLFYSLPFFNFFKKEFEIDLWPEVVGALHHHEKDSDDGFVHSDYVQSNFTRDALINGLNPASGTIKRDGPKVDLPGVVHAARALGLIYYLNNPIWQPGDGGETSLHRAKSSAPEVKVAPLNNRLLAFEVSPNSYHAFLKNVTGQRNSVIIWLHTDPKTLRERWNKEPPFFHLLD